MFLRNARLWKAGILVVLLGGLGCQLFSDHISRWRMLDKSALDDPIHAIGGDGIIYSPKEDRAMTRQQLEDAKPDELIAYYAPIFIQQRVDSNGQPFPYPREYDEIGEASCAATKTANIRQSFRDSRDSTPFSSAGKSMLPTTCS